ncbi:MAG: hypothetical protein GY874_04570 [Desulfobacteraceae bacterium]|nr:hypothetical protein [Desulfobacteraceae bacterium]
MKKDSVEPLSQDQLIANAINTGPAYQKDKHFYRIIVCSLGLAALLSVIFVFLLAKDGIEIPDAFIAFGSGAIGAIAGVLSGNGGSNGYNGQ